jgi:hypothetical protein
MTTARTAVGSSPSAGDGTTSPDASAFGGSRACFEDIVGWLEGTEAASLSHGELEDDLDRRGRELLRRLLQDHLDLRAAREERVEVIDADGRGRRSRRGSGPATLGGQAGSSPAGARPAGRPASLGADRA